MTAAPRSMPCFWSRIVSFLYANRSDGSPGVSSAAHFSAYCSDALANW
jgi:hypothetical protein